MMPFFRAVSHETGWRRISFPGFPGSRGMVGLQRTSSATSAPSRDWKNMWRGLASGGPRWLGWEVWSPLKKQVKRVGHFDFGVRGLVQGYVQLVTFFCTSIWVCVKIGLKIRDSFFSSIFFSVFGRDFVVPKNFWRMANLLWAHTKLMGRYCVRWFSILWIRDFEWPCLLEGEHPKTWTISKIPFNDIFILKFHKRRETSKFLLGGHVIVSKKQWDLQIPWARETPANGGRY